MGRRLAGLLVGMATLLAACTGGVAQPATPAPITVTPTVTAVRTVTVPPPAYYRTAAVAPATALRLAALSWWNTPGDVNGKSTLTTKNPRDDSANIYVNPTTPVQASEATVQQDSSAGNRWQGAGLTSTTNGQLIALSDNYYYSCSATVVHSPSRNMVLTAAHCVWNMPSGKPHSQGGQKMTQLGEIWFVPAASKISTPLVVDSDGDPEVNAPYGIWRVASISTNQNWLQNTWVEPDSGTSKREESFGPGSSDDVAFLTMKPRHGKNIESVTGGQGLMFSDTGSLTNSMTYPTVVLGYPAAAPFDGRSERYCTDRSPDALFGDATVVTSQVHCLMSPGASGGAWFTGFDPTAGSGYVYGVTSRGSGTTMTSGTLSLLSDYPLYLQAGTS